MSTSKILTDLCAIKQSAKVKNSFANIVYNVLLFFRVLVKHRGACLKINGK